ncbi:MAG: YybH family protein [Myxococcaceae bacterium]
MCAGVLVASVSLAKKPRIVSKGPDSFGNAVSQGTVKQWDKVTDEFAQAWNAGDAGKVMSFFQADATYLSPTGEVASGRQEISSLIQREQQGALKNFRTNLKVDSVRSFAPAPQGGQIVVADLSQELIGGTASSDANPPLPTDLRVTIVGTRVGDRWLFDAVRVYPDVKASMGVGGSGPVAPSAAVAPISDPIDHNQGLRSVPFVMPTPDQPLSGE